MPHSTSPTLTSITLSQEELSSKTLASTTLREALQALHQDGVVVIENAVDPTHLDILNTRMVSAAKEIYATTKQNFGEGTGNIQQDMPLDPEYTFNDVIANPLITAITECMLGPNPHLRFQSANTAFKAEKRQPVHSDIIFEYSHCPFGLCINTNFIDVDPQHGSTEIWLGTHTNTDWTPIGKVAGGTPIPEDLLEERRKVSPPIQPTLKKGSMIIRDIRLWHAGMPNLTDEVRVMHATIHFGAWTKTPMKIKLAESLKGKIEWGNLVPCVEWVADS